jgi:predicted RNA-binding Zn-ribbon protein involved in translation (DUF1610 family)
MMRHGSEKAQPPCPRCGNGMKLVNSVPKFGALPELLVFACPACNEVHTTEKPGPADLPG